MNEREITPEDRRSIDKTLRVFDVFRAVDPTFRLGVIASFLHVAYNEGQTERDLEALGISRAAANNHARYLGEGSARGGKPGLGLIAAHRGSSEDRARRLSLTLKGQLLVAEIADAVGRVVLPKVGPNRTALWRRHEGRCGPRAGASRGE